MLIFISSQFWSWHFLHRVTRSSFSNFPFRISLIFLGLNLESSNWSNYSKFQVLHSTPCGMLLLCHDWWFSLLQVPVTLLLSWPFPPELFALWRRKLTIGDYLQNNFCDWFLSYLHSIYRGSKESLEDCFWEAWACLCSSSTHLKVRWHIAFNLLVLGVVDLLFSGYFFQSFLLILEVSVEMQQRTRVERVIGFVLAIWGILFYTRLLSTMTEQFRVLS